MSRDYLNILGYSYELIFRDEPGVMMGNMGAVNIPHQKITIDHLLECDQLEETLIHEVIHVIDETLLLQLNHENISRLAVGLFSAGVRIPRPHACADIGTYANQVVVIPPWVTYRGHHDFIGIDKCIFNEVSDLWAMMIRTIESCCGHGKAQGYIAVEKESCSKMEQLGYKHDTRADDPSFVFLAKSTCERTI